MATRATTTECHLYQIKLPANPMDVPGVIGAIQNVLAGLGSGYTGMTEYNGDWYCLSEKPPDELQAHLEKIPGVKSISEFDPCSLDSDTS